MKILNLIAVLLMSFIGVSQTWTPKQITVNNNIGGFYEYLPVGYNGVKKFPLILFLHGVGELGDGKTQLNSVCNTGLPQLINLGQFPSSFTVNGQVHSFIVIAPQFKNWPSPTDVSSMMSYILSNYLVDETRIYVTGLSMGGGNTWDYTSSSSTVSSKLAAILPICGASSVNTQGAQNIANSNLPVLATHNADDGTVSVNNTIGWVDGINSFNPPTKAVKVIWSTGGHDAWTTTYNPNNKFINNLNCYEWLLQFKRGSSNPPNYVEAKNANDPTTVVPYNGIYGYGSNMGYFGGHFNDKDVAQLIYNAGARTSRPSLPDWLITGYGVNARIQEFQFYDQMGLKDLTAFVGEPNGIYSWNGGTLNRETITFPGCPEPAKTFKGLYEPIWLDANKTQPNPANTFAYYLYQTAKTYGSYVKFWEIVNEPDFTWGDEGWNDGQPYSWYKQNPDPKALVNLYAPIQYYIRMLRVAWEVIKTVDPNDYVCTGGIGYSSFLDALLRNTDNPVDGSVTAEYPNKAGAYFDVLSYHDYPQYGLAYWDPVKGQVAYTRHSDAAANFHIASKNKMDSILKKYNYGVTLPTKQWICTETDLGSQNFANDGWGSPEASKNFVIKQNVLSQLNDIKQVYKWGVSKKSNPTYSFESMGLYYDLDNPTATVLNAKPTPEFYENKTASEILYGKKIDKIKTSQLNLPNSVNGAAFLKNDGKYIYVLWAKTNTDLSEDVSTNYTFPFSFYGTKKFSDFIKTGVIDTIKTLTIQLNSSPSFFEELSPPEIPKLVVSISSKTDVSCYNGSDGTAKVSISGGAKPYDVSWNTSPVQKSETATGLKSGTYTVTVKDSINNVLTASVTIEQPTKLLISVNPGLITSFGGTTSVGVSASGGTPPYTFVGATTNVTAGNYTYKVSDSKSCLDTLNITITQPDPPKEDSSFKFSVYPNPTHGLVYVTYRDKNKIYKSLRVISNSGNIIRIFKIPEINTFSIDLNYLNKGLYYIQLENRKTIKLIKI